LKAIKERQQAKLHRLVLQNVSGQAAVVDSPFRHGVGNSPHHRVAIGDAKPGRPVVEVIRGDVESTDTTQRFRPHEHGVDVRGAGQNITEPDRPEREDMRRNAAERFRDTVNLSACHSEAEARVMTTHSSDEGGDAMRQRDIVVVEKDDELAARCVESQVTRATDAQSETAHHTKPIAIGELVAIIDNDDLDIFVRLGSQRRQGLLHVLRTAVRRDNRSDFGRHGPRETIPDRLSAPRRHEIEIESLTSCFWQSA